MSIEGKRYPRRRFADGRVVGAVVHDQYALDKSAEKLRSIVAAFEAAADAMGLRVEWATGEPDFLIDDHADLAKGI